MFGDTFENPFFSTMGIEQQAYAASEFGGAPNDVMIITGLAFRLNDHPSGASMDATIPLIRFQIGVFPGPMSLITEDVNWNLPAPLTVYEMRSVRLRAGGKEPPSEFDVKFTFERPFFYDRTRGQLVLEIHSQGQWMGEPGDMDAHRVSFDRGAYIYSEPGGIYRKVGLMMATKFFYKIIAATIDSIRVDTDTNSVEIDFSFTDTPHFVQVEGSPTVDGTFSREPGVELSQVSPGKMRAIVAVSTVNRFFRIQLQ